MAEIGRRPVGEHWIHGRPEPETGALIARTLTAIKGSGIVEEIGIETENDLFGGIVSYGFVATKAISHSTVEPAATAPVGWSHEFGQKDTGCRPVRIKPVREKGGRG